MKSDELAAVVAGGRALYPLTAETIEGTAAALKQAHFIAGHQYLSELRQGHIESGFDVPAWMTLLLVRCRKSLERGLGPPDRAPELLAADLISDDEAKALTKGPTT